MSPSRAPPAPSAAGRPRTRHLCANTTETLRSARPQSCGAPHRPQHRSPEIDASRSAGRSPAIPDPVMIASRPIRSQRILQRRDHDRKRVHASAPRAARTRTLHFSPALVLPCSACWRGDCRPPPRRPAITDRARPPSAGTRAVAQSGRGVSGWADARSARSWRSCGLPAARFMARRSSSEQTRISIPNACAVRAFAASVA